MLGLFAMPQQCCGSTGGLKVQAGAGSETSFIFLITK